MVKEINHAVCPQWQIRNIVCLIVLQNYYKWFTWPTDLMRLFMVQKRCCSRPWLNQRSPTIGENRLTAILFAQSPILTSTLTGPGCRTEMDCSLCTFSAWLFPTLSSPWLNLQLYCPIKGQKKQPYLPEHLTCHWSKGVLMMAGFHSKWLRLHQLFSPDQSVTWMSLDINQAAYFVFLHVLTDGKESFRNVVSRKQGWHGIQNL